MFVVRIIVDDDKTDFKAFERLPDAKKRFEIARQMAWRDEVEHATLFDVPNMDVRSAVNAVRVGDAGRVFLLDDQLCQRLEIEKLRKDIVL